MRTEKTLDTSSCTHCQKCRRNCSFLEKYELVIGDAERLRELAYHCFLCGRCTEVCPEGIDGREIILNMRRERVREAGDRVPEKGYGGVLFEKKDYIYKNYRRARGKSVLFPGCNFPSFYPKTTEKLIRVLQEEAGMGVVFDCCGKPVAELGLEKQEEKILAGLKKRLEEKGVTELVTMCPNCYDYLGTRLGIPIISIYEKLGQLGIGKQAKGGAPMFLPCPDRQKKALLEQIEPFLEQPCTFVKDVQCCGLGGCAAVREPEIAKGFAEDMEGETVYTYCGSCAGNLYRNGVTEVRHVLTEIMEVEEVPDVRKSALNRMKTRFK